jgi:hypothetical protein
VVVAMTADGGGGTALALFSFCLLTRNVLLLLCGKFTDNMNRSKISKSTSGPITTRSGLKAGLCVGSRHTRSNPQHPVGTISIQRERRRVEVEEESEDESGDENDVPVTGQSEGT